MPSIGRLTNQLPLSISCPKSAPSGTEMVRLTSISSLLKHSAFAFLCMWRAHGSHKDWRPAVTTDSAWCLDLPIHPFMDAMSPSPHGVMQRFLPSGIDPDVCPQLGTKDLARCFGQFHSSECLKCPSRRGRNRSRLRIMLLRLAAPRSDSSGSDSPG